jgi:hypothetical protein
MIINLIVRGHLRDLNLSFNRFIIIIFHLDYHYYLMRY